MDLDSLKDSLEMVDDRITHVLASRITRPYRSCKNLGRRLHGLLSFFRTRGVLSYLVDGDIPRFFADLAREAQTYRTFLEAFHAKLDVAAEDVEASFYPPFVCAIAAGSASLCQDLDRLMPTARRKGEDREAFAFATMLRTLACRPSDEKEALAEFESQCSAAPQLEHLVVASRGLVEKDPKVFKKGLTSYLDSFATLTEGQGAELDPGDDVLSVEGLAFLRLAEWRGLKVVFAHDMTPSELRRAPPAIPVDGYPSWPG